MARLPVVLLGAALAATPLAAARSDNWWNSSDSSTVPLAAARSDNVPDALSVEWQGQKPCEKLFEDARIRIARCIFPPGTKHVRHSHPGYFSYVLSGGKGQIQEEKGTRQVEPRTDTYTNSSPIPWHELTNAGDTTLRYLVIERKYEPVPGGTEQAAGK